MDSEDDILTTPLIIRSAAARERKKPVAYIEKLKAECHQIDESIKKDKYPQLAKGRGYQGQDYLTTHWAELEAELLEYGQPCQTGTEYPIQQPGYREDHSSGDPGVSTVVEKPTVNESEEDTDLASGIDVPLDCGGSGRHRYGPYRSLDNSSYSTESATSASDSVRPFSSEDASEGSRALLAGYKLSPKSEEMCESLRDWHRLTDDAQSVDKCDALRGGKYQNKPLSRKGSDCGPSWDALDKQEVSTCERYDSCEKVGIEACDEDNKSAQPQWSIIQAGNAVGEDDSIEVDQEARSRRSRCPSRDLAESTSGSGSENASTVPIAEESHNNSSSTCASPTATIGITSARAIVAAAGLLRNSKSRVLSSIQTGIKDVPKNTQARQTMPQRPKRHRISSAGPSDETRQETNRLLLAPPRKKQRGSASRRVLMG
jgi:hypothetical protein